VTGAGDSLLASVAVAMTRGMSLMEASALGCCISALAVQTVGNYPASLESVKKYFHSKSVEL
jgi:sugar/nucleoside kinase (ribokinase family)